jgi:hypothetical protein
MKKSSSPVKLPPLVAAGSIKRSGSRGRISLDIRNPLPMHARRLRSRENAERKDAASALARIIKSKNCLIDSIDALRILGKEARGRNLEAAQTMVQELGRDAYQESLRSTGTANQRLISGMTILLGLSAAAAFFSGYPPLVIVSLPAFLISAALSFASLFKEGAPINILKMSSKKAGEILKGMNK